ncbi:hypothetical protein ANN_01987 [Periplaneta americana]|uniref:Uncharacterized protein n=1 Tax=Periplaneta americana TaxID=6978 RepID=A0ABQ8TY27_PERAM|nr:hypothetical protein ANN_01987 [Periplaneta americana]
MLLPPTGSYQIMNLKESKIMTNHVEEIVELVPNNPIEYVQEIVYLGETVSFSRRTSKEIVRHIVAAWATFWALKLYC